VLLLSSAAANSAAPTLSGPDLDALVQQVMAQEHVVGASVLVAQAGRILLHKGFGLADLALEAPAKAETVRVFDENGRLMIQPLGEGPERLLKQEDGKFFFRSPPNAQVSFVMQNDRAITMKMDSPDFPLAGDRVGDADPATFHMPRI
jgi:hypothetical protein